MTAVFTPFDLKRLADMIIGIPQIVDHGVLIDDRPPLR